MTVDKRLNKAQFAHLIPHVGNMILIDTVDFWADKQIICRSRTHLDPANPLRLNNTLSSMHLIEYGAQAMAIHGGLLSGKSSPGFLAAARNVHFYIDDLSEITGDILINAHAELKLQNGAVYALSISDTQQRPLLDASATVITL